MFGWLRALLQVIRPTPAVPSNRTEDAPQPAEHPAEDEHAAIRPLLDLIARVEARSNPNAYFRHPNNIDSPPISRMRIADVLHWQRAYVASGSYSSAAGKYQIIRPTLEQLVRTLELSGDEIFDAAMQDRMARCLLDGRGLRKFMSRMIGVEQFAENISWEWASFPTIVGPKRGSSQYAGDGVNKALVGVDEVFEALERVRSASSW